MASFNERYEGTPPWDIGRPQPAVVRLADEGAFRGRVLDAGCGTGEHAILLAQRGLAVTGVDAAPRAIEKAKAKARARGAKVDLLVADALDLGALGRQFESVLDVGLFHVFDDEDRARYVESLASVVEPGGRYHMLVFSDREPPGWGPRRVREKEIRDAFAHGWRVLRVEPAQFESLMGPAQAWLAVVERAAP